MGAKSGYNEQDKGHLTPSKSALTPLNPQKQLQRAMEILPNFKAHWESLIEEINVVSKFSILICWKPRFPHAHHY